MRLALSLVAGSLAAVGLYAVLRLAQAVLYREADPALVVWSEHSGYFWRALTAGYGGGMVAFVTWIAARDLERLARYLERALLATAALILLQGLLVP